MASPLFNLLFRHFGLLLCLVIVVNAMAWWSRGVRRYPERRESYRKLTVGLACWGSLPFLVLEIGVLLGLSEGGLEMLEPGKPTFFAGLFYGVCVLLWLIGTYWMLFSGGADSMARHPGLLNVDSSSPKAWKLLWLIVVVGGVVGLWLRFLRPSG